MTAFHDAYQRAMAKKGAEAKKLKAANAAFGGQSNRLEALYGSHSQTARQIRGNEKDGLGQKPTSEMDKTK